MNQHLAKYGIPESGGQRNDCTIVALSLTTGVPYNAVAMALRAYGKRDNCGFRFNRWMAEHDGRVFGCTFTPVWQPTDLGYYILHENGHVAAFVDGRVLHRLAKGVRWVAVYRCVRGTQEVDKTTPLWRGNVAAALQD